VIAKSFARIFYRNAFNMGLPILESAEASEGVEGGHEIEVELDTGAIRNLTTGKTFQARPVPPFMQQLLRDGGLMAHLAKRIATR
jgi:3-isopropylmalate/(R)-2-methylmalate dehydratase small subunit